MAIDFTLSPELERLRDRVRQFVSEVIIPEQQRFEAEDLQETDRQSYLQALVDLRRAARSAEILSRSTSPKIESD